MFQGYREYRRREFCNDIKCPVQMELNKHDNGSEHYEKIRETCRNSCIKTTYEFHHWLIEKGFLVLKEGEDGLGKEKQDG